MIPIQPITHVVFQTRSPISPSADQIWIVKENSVSIPFNHARDSWLNTPKLSLQISNIR